jgi:predicted aspartyl protease
MKFSLALGLQKTGLPLIVTSGKLKNLCFLIDTGATHNVLFTYVYEHFKSEFKLLSEKQNIMGIEGHCKETPIIEATFDFEGSEYTSTFSVFDATEAIAQVQQETGVQIHGILSTDFLIQNKWIINFDKLIISTNDLE